MNYQYFGLFLDEPTRNKLMHHWKSHHLQSGVPKRKYYLFRSLHSSP